MLYLGVSFEISLIGPGKTQPITANNGPPSCLEADEEMVIESGLTVEGREPDVGASHMGSDSPHFLKVIPIVMNQDGK